MSCLRAGNPHPYPRILVCACGSPGSLGNSSTGLAGGWGLNKRVFSFDLACAAASACKDVDVDDGDGNGDGDVGCLPTLAHKKCNYVHKMENEARKWSN